MRLQRDSGIVGEEESEIDRGDELKSAMACERSVGVDVPVEFAWQFMTDIANWSDPPAQFTLEGHSPRECAALRGCQRSQTGTGQSST
jgi:hypothetical protein